MAWEIAAGFIIAIFTTSMFYWGVKLIKDGGDFDGRCGLFMTLISIAMMIWIVFYKSQAFDFVSM